MAVFNHEHADRLRRQKQNFEEMKDFLSSDTDDGKFSKWIYALEHIRGLEDKVKEQEESIKEYKKFFSLLNKHLPNECDRNIIYGSI